MKSITVDPADEEESDPPGFSSSSEEDETLLDLRELSLDRTSPEVENDPLPEQVPLPAEGSSKIGRPKRPSFREMFRLPRKKRSSSKNKPTGCAGWLDKKRKKTQSESSFDEIPQSDQDRSINCSRCGENSITPLKGVTYSKNSSGIFNMDGDWLCPQCSSRGSSLESDQSIHQIPRLSYLVMDVVKLHPQMFTLTNLNSVRKREDLGADGVTDMITISDLNEASLLWNLKTRYDHQNIYTFIGNILVSVNPYQMFDVYGLDMVKKYENEILGTLPPHLFAIGSAAYDRLVSRDQPAGGESQVVIISGESGAGKTEATKLIMQYLAAVNKKDGASLVTEQILEASPLLESFGNATTVRNDNSSRFGKYTQIFFQNGVINGAKITEYLLEKSRIVTQAADERNYHVFYELLKGLRTEEKERYGLTAAENYFYLNQGGHCESSTKHDGQDFKALMSAMQILDFSSEEQDTIFRILASVLHLGNVFFHRKALKHGQEGVEMGSDAEVRWVSHLLQLRTDGIVSALTTKTTEARNERLHTPLNIDQALDARDAIAKALYSSLFGWLVNRVNSIVNKGERSTAINILDIFGFEDFPENSFEQLCINYANENLQFHFNKHIFKLEQQEYAKERIEWQTISFTDNQPVISLIAKKPIGVLHLLDDESNFPKATDASFLEKCHYNHALNELYFRPRMSSMEFGIKHYAGQVWYNADGFLDKNRDTLRPDVVELLISSRIQMISRMFQDMKRSQDLNKTVNKGDGRFITMKPRTATVAARFHDSLQALLDSMSKCNPWFVRCLKPNRDKAPMTFDLPVVLEQLRYTGMLETIRIRKLGFPIRMRFDQFLERYGCLLTRRERRSLTRQTPSPDICRLLLDRNSSDGQDFQLGTSKVFMRELLEQQLERKRQDQLKEAAIKIQRSVRTHLDRRDFLIKRQSAILIQAWVRRYQAQKRYKTIRKGVVLAQAHFRATRQRRLYKELREELQRRQASDQVKPASRKQQESAAATFSVNHKEMSARGINQLEIPAELAFIYSKLDDWKPIHTERNVVKVVGAVPAAETDRQLPNDLDHHAFTKFTNIYFKSHLWGAKKDPITTPLLPKNSEADVTESLAIFKLILRFTSGPRSSDPVTQTKREMALGNYIVHKGIVNEQLRDEIYCQLCNQTWKNEDPQAVGRCWILMANCLSAFPPSPALYKYLLKYVSDHAYDGYRATCQQKLMQAYELDPPISRAYPPTVMEWKANRKCVNMALEARYPDDESRHAGVDSWSTAESVASLLMRSRGMEPGEAEGWTLSLGQENDWYDLNGHDFVLDVVSELETPPAFPIHKEGHFLNSSQYSPPTRNTRNSGNARLPPRPPGAGNESGRRSAAVIGNKRYMKSEQHQGGPRSPGKFSRSLDNLLNTEPISKPIEVEANQMGLSRSRLNDRYRSMDKLKTSNSSLGMIQRSESQRHSGVVHPRPATAGGEAEWGKLGLSSSALNSRYFSQQNLKGGPRQTTDSDSSEPAEKPRRKKSSASKSNSQNLPKRREPSGRGGDSSGDNLSDMDYRGASSGAGHSGGASRNNNKEEYFNGRNGRFIKAPLPGNAIKKGKGAVHSSRAYIETRHSEPREHLGSKSSGLSDTSETVSLSSHVRRVRVPSQSSDVDQYLDDLFMPVLDGNMDEYSDARSLAASIKGGRRNNDNLDDFLNDIVDTIRPDSSLLELEGASLPELIQGGAKGHNKEPKSGGFHQGQAVSGRDSSASFQPIGINIAAPPTPLGMVPTPSLLMPGYYGAYGHPFAIPGGPIPADPSGGFNKYPGEYPPHLFGPASPLPFPYTTSSPLPFFHLPQGYASMGAPTNVASGPSSATDLNRAFLQSAVVQNMQIQQQLMAQNQALQQLLQAQVAPTILVPPTSSHSLITPISPTPPAVHAPNSVQQEDPVDYDDTDSSSCSIGEGAGADVNNDDSSLWRIEGPPSSSLLSRTGSRGIGDQAPPPPVLPKVRRDSGLPVLESRPSFSHRVQSDGTSEHALSRKRDSIGTEPTVFKGAPPPPPPPLPPEPIFGDPSAATHNLMDPYGRAKTVRIGKWRWPPARSDDDPAPPLTTGSFLEFKMQKNLHKKNNKAQESPQSYEGVEWDSFEIDEDSKGEEENDPPQDRKSSSSSRERSISPVRGPPREAPSKPAGSIGKLKISSEMRAKLELVTVAHGETSNRPAGQQQPIEPERNAGVVRKLEENRRLMLQQQLAGRKWDSVEEVERITRRAQSEDRSDFNHQNASRPSVAELAERARRNSETAIRRSSSPPTPFFSMHENGHEMRKLSIDDDLAVKALEGIHTKLYGPLNAPFFTYNMVPWTLHVRKELFSPSENSLVHPLALHLIFCQVVQDTYNDACLRIGHEDRIRMQNMLENYGITPINASGGHHKVTLKRNVVETAKQWPLYFARLYPVSGGKQLADVQYLAVSHSGIRLVKRESGHQRDTLHVLQSFGFSDISNVSSSPRSSALQIHLRSPAAANSPLHFFTQRAGLIRDLIHRFANEAEKEPEEYVRAVADYVTRESSLLSFRKGDVIRVIRDEQYVDKGWMFGKLDGRVGIFPADYVEPMSRKSKQEDGPVSPHDTSLDLGSSDTSRMEDPGSPTQPNDGKHSLLQFALYHFRQSPENKFEMLRSEDGPNSLSPSTNGKSDKKSKSKSKKSGAKDQSRSSDGVTAGSDWTWKEQVDLVKFTKSPIQASLLQLDSNDLNKLALECFLSIMRYMGDYPMAKGQSEVDNVYTILMNCHKHESLRDETYCQIMKQTTNNKSSRPDSCQRGWRLFSITAAYFSCSEVLKPYLFKYLETAAYDKRRAYHGTAMVCLQNLRKTLRYGGRKNVPSIEEITAITAGRNSKRQMYRLPGGTERVINTKSTSVVQDIIEEICSVINVRSEQEMEEYSLYCIVEGDTFTMPLAREEYILDVTTELQKNQQVYYLIFCRSVWHYPMRLDNSLYIEIVFNQIAPDYLEGLLLVMPGEQISQDCVYDIAKVAALLHRAADLDHMPTMKETKYLLPKPALSVRDIKPPQWVNLVQSSWREVEHLKPSQAKAQVLEILEKWPLFGSSFFAVRRDSDPAERSEHILALNRNGVHFLDVITHETLMHHPYSEVISTRKVKSDDGILFLDMKCGNLMQQRVTRIQTDQAHEISRLIRQYITIQQRVQQKDAESNLASR